MEYCILLNKWLAQIGGWIEITFSEKNHGVPWISAKVHDIKTQHGYPSEKMYKTKKKII